MFNPKIIHSYSHLALAFDNPLEGFIDIIFERDSLLYQQKTMSSKHLSTIEKIYRIYKKLFF